MSFTSYRCKHCGQTRTVATSRITQASIIRCDACFAISSLSPSERQTLLSAASPGRAGERRLRSFGLSA